MAAERTNLPATDPAGVQEGLEAHVELHLC